MDGRGAEVRGFTPFVQERIGWYVYLLRDPRDGEVFYVGKGRGNRVFQHAQDAFARPDEPGEKLGRIRAIRSDGLEVTTEILRHGIDSEKQAYVVEAAAIDVFRAIGRRHALANQVIGHHVALHGWASTTVVASLYEAPAFAQTNESIVFLKIPNLWTPAMDAGELFEATRGWWAVSGKTVSRARYAIAVVRGVTRAVYEIDYWRERVGGDRDFTPAGRRRLGFWGREVPERLEFLNRSIRHLSQSAGSPVVYLNCGNELPARTPVHTGDEAVREAAVERTLKAISVSNDEVTRGHAVDDEPGGQLDALVSLADAGLPPPPGLLRAPVRRVAPWAWGTRAFEPVEMYMFRRDLALAAAHSHEPQWFLCHAGHGVNSYALTLLLSCGPLVAFVQHPWGGALSDQLKDAGELASSWQRLGLIVSALDASNAGQGGRLLFELSPMRRVARLTALDGEGRLASEARDFTCVEESYAALVGALPPEVSELLRLRSDWDRA